MAVFLTILKIIGIVLLCILGFVLFLLLLILLAPIHYKAEGSFEDGNIAVTAKVRYLLFITVPVSFIDKKLKVAAKVFGFKVFKIGYDEEPSKEAPSKEPDFEEIPENLEFKELKAEAKDSATSDTVKVDEEPKPEVKSDDKTPEVTVIKLDNVPEATDSTEEENAEEPEKEKKPLKEKILDLVDKGIHFYQAFREALSNELNQIGTFIKRKSTKFTFDKVRTKLIKILKHIMPRKLSGDATIGFDDPATTGYMCAGASLVYGYYRNFDLTPDFSGKTMDGHFKLKGHIILGYIVWHGLTLIIRKKVRKCIKQAKQLANDSMTNVNNIKEGLNYGRSEI